MKYIKKIIIDNFQSHAHSELNFELGLNIIVGQSDKGKSAVLRALKWVLYNEPRGSDFIRYGTNECSVTIVTGDDYTVTRRKKGNKNIYIVIKPDGEKLEFENFGNDVPVEVIEATGVNSIKLDTDTVCKMNINEQLEAPFLLSETGTMRAKTIGRIVNTNIIDAAERDIQKDILNNNTSIKNIEKQIADIDEEIIQYSNITEIEQNIQKLDTLIEKLSSVNVKFEKLQEYKCKIDSIDTSITKGKELISKLKPLPSILDLYDNLKDKSSHCQRLSSYKNKLSSINLDIDKSNRVMEKVKHLNAAESHLNDISNKNNTCIKITELFEKYSDICSKIIKGSDYMKSLNHELKNSVENYSAKLKHLGKCPTCYSLISDSTISQIINELEGELNVGN